MPIPYAHLMGGSPPYPWVTPGSNGGSLLLLGSGMAGTSWPCPSGRALLWARRNTWGLDGSILVWDLLLCAGALPARVGVAGRTRAWGGLSQDASAGTGVLQAAPHSAWHPRDGTAVTRSLPTGC